MLAALAIGASAGVVNGVLVTLLRVPALIVTLGMLNMARGVAMLINGGVVVPLIPRLIKDPALDTFIFIGRGRLFDTIPTMSIGFLLVLVVGYRRSTRRTSSATACAPWAATPRRHAFRASTSSW